MNFDICKNCTHINKVGVYRKYQCLKDTFRLNFVWCVEQPTMYDTFFGKKCPMHKNLTRDINYCQKCNFFLFTEEYIRCNKSKQKCFSKIDDPPVDCKFLLEQEVFK